MFNPILQRALDDAKRGRLAQAIADVRRLAQRQPKDVNALLVLSILLMQEGQTEQAAHHLSRAVALAPNSATTRSNYAGVLMHLGRHDDAADQLRRAVVIDPSMPDLWSNLAAALLKVADAAGAVVAAQRGLELAPNSPTHSLNLVMALEKAGRPEEGLDIAERVHVLHPGDAKLHSQYLLMLNATDRSAESIAERHREFGQRHPVIGQAAATVPDPDRDLRIGWLSADLRTHSVAYFAEALIANRPAWAAAHVFSERPDTGDPITRRLKAAVDSWNEVGHLDAVALDGLIKKERIDVLIETSGHTGDNRLPALAARPAPIIIDAIGYPNTTGFSAVDYRLVDSITDPPGSEALSTERLLRIDPCFLCYRPPVDAPEPVMPASGMPPTFGSFNTPHKINARTAALWSAAVNAVSGSRLVLKAMELRDPSAREALVARLVSAGVDESRIELLPGTPTVRDHLATYSRVHVALDPFPYNGTTTTCEALHMGVPVISLQGDRHAARVGASLLGAAGHPEWAARSEAEFVSIAAAMVVDRDRLAALRRSLRPSMERSALYNGQEYSARFYRAVRGCWQEYCRTRGEAGS